MPEQGEENIYELAIIMWCNDSQPAKQFTTKFTTGPWRLLQNDVHCIVLDSL